MLIYFLMRYGERPNLKYSLLIAVVVWVYAQLHFYFFAIAAFSISFFFLFWVLQKWRWKAIPMYFLHYTIQILLPLIYFQWWVNGLDTVSDRSKAPWGFMAYRGRPEGTFISEHQPHLEWLRNEVLKVGYIDFEAQTYLGLVAIIGLVILLVRWFKNLLRVKPVVDLGGKGRFLNAMFYAGLVLLLFGFGLPFTIHGLDWLLEYAGPIRQFRSVSRFIWLFYFVSNIIIFTWLYQSLKGKKWAWAIWIPAFVLLGYEAYHFSSFRDMRLDSVEREAYGKRFIDIDGINYNDYQAILTIPYCNIGSDQIAWECEGFIVQNTLTLSLHTGLPTTAAMLTRSSISQTFNQYQLIMEPYRSPALIKDLPSEKPFLVVFDVEKYEAEKERYEHLMASMRLIYAEGRLRLYELPISAFEKRIEERKAKIVATIQADSLLHTVNNFLYTDSTANFIFKSYDETPAANVYLGSGAYQGAMEDYNIFWEGKLPNQQARPYRMLFWLYVGKDRYSRSRLAWEEIVLATGETVQWRGEPAYRFIKLLDNGWALISLDFTPQRTDTHHRFSLQNKPLMRAPLIMDELLIFPAEQHLYRETDNYIWENNRWFPK